MPSSHSYFGSSARAVGRLIAAVLMVAACCPIGVAAEDAVDTGTAPPARRKAANESEPAPTFPPPKAFGIDGNSDAEIATVVDVWTRIRGMRADAEEAKALQDMLRKLKQSGIDAERAPRDSRVASAGRRYGLETAATQPESVARVEEPIAPPAASTVSDAKDKLISLRETARKLETMAEELDDLEFYEQADGLRQQAQAIRMQWRQLRGGPNAARIGLPTFGPPGPQ